MPGKKKLWASIQWPKLGLQSRIFLLSGLGILLMVGLLGVVGFRAVNEATQRALAHQLLIAQLAAESVDHELASMLELLDRVAAREEVNLEDGDLEPEKRLLREAHYQMGMFTYHLALLDRQGRVLWVEPYDPDLIGQNLGERPAIRRALREGRSTISGLILSLTSGRPLVALITPVRNEAGEITGLLSGEIDLTQPGLSSFLKPLRVGESGYVQLVDRQGYVLASAEPDQLFRNSGHGSRFAELIDSQQAVVRGCHACHQSSKGWERENEIIAFAPLSMAPWGVAVRQEESEALAPVHDLQRWWLAAGVVALVAGLAVAWITTSRVVRPIRALTEATSRISSGQLDVPVPVEGLDEVADLARGFEEMRVKLRAFLEAQQRWNEELEERVRQRTQELEALYEELRHKGQIQAQLLGKVISAQEEERQRIARELHDEVGQALTAVMMSTALAEQSLPQEMAEAKNKLIGARSLTAQALKDLRRLIFDLRPELLDDLGLVPALRRYIKEHMESAGLKVHLEAVGLRERLPSPVEIALFRVMQEALTNVLRHAQANRVWVRLEKRDTTLTALVEDDGIGFDAARLLAREGDQVTWGLRGMEERIHLLGGHLHIDSTPGQGTRVIVEIPLEE